MVVWLNEIVFGLEGMFISQVFWMPSAFFTAEMEILVTLLIERVGTWMEPGGIEIFGKTVMDRTGIFLSKGRFFV